MDCFYQGPDASLFRLCSGTRLLRAGASKFRVRTKFTKPCGWRVEARRQVAMMKALLMFGREARAG
ncbi:MAG: hypothetical protein D6763_01505 [Alphaproteobacteria bacterium]|nr:MAG: hypothetical protein D6763_01505 [Alphaproteobacteria bacterium]